MDKRDQSGFMTEHRPEHPFVELFSNSWPRSLDWSRTRSHTGYAQRECAGLWPGAAISSRVAVQNETAHQEHVARRTFSPT